MPPAAVDATVIVFDCGKSTEIQCDSDTFFNISKGCLMKILQRKIFNNPNDLIGIIFMGSDETLNDLNVDFPGRYENIAKGTDLRETSWEMLELFEEHLKVNSVDADWMEALEVAVDYLQKETSGKKVKDVQIVLISPLSGEMQIPEAQYKKLIAGMKDSDVYFTVITHNIPEDLPIERLVNEMEGSLCTFHNALAQLMYFQQKKTRSMPWNVDLTIGSEFKIKVASYLYIKRPSYLKAWKVQAEYTGEDATTSYQHFKGGEKYEPDPSVIIKAYMYGSTIVPYEHEIDDLKSTGKSLMCIGFSPEGCIRPKYFTGSGTNVILPQKNCPVSAKMFFSLVEAMRKQKVVMIARRVYNIRSKPKIEALIPCQQDGVPYLTMLELPFSDGTVDFHFNAFCDKKTQPNQEQLEAVDKLIDGMDLMTAAEDDGEAFTSRNTINLTAQFTYRILAARALHPAQPLPALDEDLREHLIVPKKLQPHVQEVSEELKKLFPLVPKTETKKDLWLKKLFKPLANPDEPAAPADEDGTSVLNVVDSDIVEVGSVTPAEDFAFLMNRGEKFTSICSQIQVVIANLVFSVTILQREKVVKAIFAMREAVKVMEAAYRYNEWIADFQARLVERKKGEFWMDVIVKEGLGLITASEHVSSTVSDEEAAAFYKIDPNAVPTTAPVPEASGNVEDLFDDM